jgi:N-acetyl-1-D-myo-inositol-2-amino-2-deoxy-alpha-D-glucopyranoside deacetylase
MTTTHTTALHTFDSIAKRGDRLVVVVPHPDDETFGCGSLIAQAADIGIAVTVICATRGEAGERIDGTETGHLPLAEVRERELRDAATVLGAQQVTLLDHADSGFDGPLPERALCSVAVETLATEIEVRLRTIRPHVVVTLDGGDGHRDHLHMRSAVELAISRMDDRPTLVLSCLANNLMRMWVDEMQTVNPGTVYLEADVAGLGRPDDELVPIDASGYVEVRERAIACHRSQRSPYEGLSLELRRAFLATDFVEINRNGAQVTSPNTPTITKPTNGIIMNHLITSTLTMTPFDLYRDIHKAVRAAMFEVTLEAGRLDPTDRSARRRLAESVRELVELLRFHAEHEDVHIEAAIAEVLPERAAEIAAEHDTLHARMYELVDIADLALDETRTDDRAAVHHLYMELASFVSAYLAHQDLEERIVMPALWDAFDFETLLGIHNTILASIAPDDMAKALTVMLPNLNNDDRVELLGGMQASAPPEVFDGVFALATQVLAEADIASVANRIGRSPILAR